MKARHPFWHLWAWPIALGVLSACGLVSARFSDGGAGAVLAWITLAVPVLVGAWYGCWMRSGRRNSG